MNKDLLDFQQGIYDLTKELGTDKILFYPLDPTVKPNIYGESKGKVYLDPINLVGSVKSSRETTLIDNHTSIGLKDIEITLPTLSMTLNNLTTKELDNGYIEVGNIKYNVVEVIPSDMFLGDYCSYICHCKEIL